MTESAGEEEEPIIAGCLPSTELAALKQGEEEKEKEVSRVVLVFCLCIAPARGNPVGPTETKVEASWDLLEPPGTQLARIFLNL